MADVKKLIAEIADDREFAQAAAVVDLVREVGDMLQRMRTRAGLTQVQLAERLDISAGRVSQLESGMLRHAPSLKTIAQFATACGETVEMASSKEKAMPLRAAVRAS
jgi:transcriptional regulator with XRE-family HTH domain